MSVNAYDSHKTLMIRIVIWEFCPAFWQNGLMLAVSKGFVDIVYGLNECPFLNINHQDNDGNTALMIAAQAGKHSFKWLHIYKQINK